MYATSKSQQRDSVKRLCTAPWTQIGAGERLIYLFGLMLDFVLDKQNQAQQFHMPGQGDPSADPYLGNDRLLVQGPAEPSADFEARLREAETTWQGAGNRPSVLSQIQAYATNLQPGVAATLREATLVGGGAAHTNWSTIRNGDAQGAYPARSRIAAGAPYGVWNWDGQTKPWRAWLILFLYPVPTGASGSAASVAAVGGNGVPGVSSGFATLTGLTGLTSGSVGQWIQLSNASNASNNGFFPIVAVTTATSCVIANPLAIVEASGAIDWAISEYPWIGPGPVWGANGATWGDTTRSWGLSCAAGVISSMRAIVKTWKSLSTYYPHIILSFGGAGSPPEFAPNSAQGAGNPDGTWGGLAKAVNHVVVPAKQPLNPYTCFCDGTGLAIDCYEQNET
jgi:hypothetical protein